MAVGLGGVPWRFGQGCRPHRPTRASQEARDLTGSRIALGHHNSNWPHNLAMDGAARPATTRVSTAVGRRSMVKEGASRAAVVERQRPVQRLQGLPASP
jgi:hypothetical protein